MIKVELKEGKWTVVKGREVLGTYDTIKAAHDAKFELSRTPAPKTLYFKQDGTEVTKRPRRAA
jgi:hypothetical protein